MVMSKLIKLILGKLRPKTQGKAEVFNSVRINALITLLEKKDLIAKDEYENILTNEVRCILGNH